MSSSNAKKKPTTTLITRTNSLFFYRLRDTLAFFKALKQLCEKHVIYELKKKYLHTLLKKNRKRKFNCIIGGEIGGEMQLGKKKNNKKNCVRWHTVINLNSL